MVRWRNFSTSVVVKAQLYLLSFLTTFSLRFYIDCFRWLWWLIFRKCKNTAPQKWSSHKPLRRTTPPTKPLSTAPPLLGSQRDFQPTSARSLLAGGLDAWAKKESWKWFTTPFPDVFSRWGTHIWNHRSMSHPAIYISSQSAIVTWHPSLVSEQC